MPLEKRERVVDENVDLSALCDYISREALGDALADALRPAVMTTTLPWNVMF